MQLYIGEIAVINLVVTIGILTKTQHNTQTQQPHPFKPHTTPRYLAPIIPHPGNQKPLPKTPYPGLLTQQPPQRPQSGGLK